MNFADTNILSLPFNRHVGIQRCTTPEHGIFELNPEAHYNNHVESFHASAIFSLAEASSGAILQQHTKCMLDKKNYIPLLRKSEIKYRNPGEGRIYTVATCREEDWEKFRNALKKNGRSIVEVPIQVIDEFGKCVAIAMFGWFVFKKPRKI